MGTIRLKKRLANTAAPTALLSGEPAVNLITGSLYVGVGDDGFGNATAIQEVPSTDSVRRAGAVMYDELPYLSVTNVAAMVAVTGLVVGNFVMTGGYYTPGDGGANIYEVVAAGTGTADGGSIINLTGSGLQARGMFPLGYRWRQWGAVGDAVEGNASPTDNHPAMQAAINYVQSVSQPIYTDSRGNPGGRWGAGAKIEGEPGDCYGISETLLLNANFSHGVIEMTTLKAIGSAWAATDHMIDRADINTEYVTLRDVQLWCDRKCGGIQTQSFWLLTRVFIRHMAVGGFGLTLRGVKTIVEYPDIKEWTIDDKGFFYNDASYGATAIRLIGIDHRVHGGEIGWCGKLIVDEAGNEVSTAFPAGSVNTRFYGVHLFNGMEDFATYNQDGSTRAANPSGTPAVGRANPIGFEKLNGPDYAPILFHGCYMDNCRVDLYDDAGVCFYDCDWNSNDLHSNADQTQWIRNYASEANAPNRLVVTNARPGVDSRPKKLVSWLANGSNTWANAAGLAAWENSPENLMSGRNNVRNLGAEFNFFVSDPTGYTISTAGPQAYLSLRDETDNWVRYGSDGDFGVVNFPVDGGVVFREEASGGTVSPVFTLRAFNQDTFPALSALANAGGTTSNFGTLITGATSGHFVVGLNENDVGDSFVIASGSGNFNSDGVYDRRLARFQAGGIVSFFGQTGFGTETPLSRIHAAGVGGTTMTLEDTGTNTAAGIDLRGRDASGNVIVAGNINATGNGSLNLRADPGNEEANTALTLEVDGGVVASVTSAGMNLSGLLTGTAVQSYAADTTAGRLMPVGAFGLGAMNAVALIDNFTADLRPGKFYRTPNLNTTTGAPPGASFRGASGVVIAGLGGAQATLLFNTSSVDEDSDLNAWFGARASESGTMYWGRLFHDKNLLGTVSQSGGVPTGAVIERGSNANGEYVRFADGTQICWHTLGFSDISTADGSIFRSASDTTWTFPAAFSATPDVKADVKTSSVEWASAFCGTTTQAALRAFRATSISGAKSFGAYAIGRWF